MVDLTAWQAALASLAGKTEHDAAYQDALFWADRPAWRPLGARDLYSCGLVARAAVRLAGGDVAPPLGGPYEGRSDVIAQLVAAARRHGCYLPVTLADAAAPGRILVIGRNGDPLWGLPACEHVVCVHLTWGVRLATVEGGQRDASGVDSAQAFERELWTRDGGVWLSRPRGEGRRVGHVIDVSAWPSAPVGP